MLRTIAPIDEEDTVSPWSGLAAREAAYCAGRDPGSDLEAVYDRIEMAGERPVWIALMPRARARAMLAEAAARRDAGAVLPLYGVPFAVKDNIDVAGLPTTAACPAFAYQPERSATVVDRLVAAGAIPIGKTNLDQFATGLNGTRSPYGAPSSVFDPTRVSGGSSSGSAVAVAAGLVPFALGTDTAGSGRVPAAFNNIVGLKPTKGLLSARGVVPACRTQDCVSVFARTVDDALRVTRIASGVDAEDPYSREAPAVALAVWESAPTFRVGTPSAPMLAACDSGTISAFERAAASLEGLGGRRIEIDFSPFRDAGELLYAGPWVAERLAAIRDFAAADPEAIHPVVREIVLAGQRHTAAEAFEGQYRLATLAALARREWDSMDVLLLPTTPFHPTMEAMLADPVGLNAQLGTFTTFVNLMDLSALAIPAGFGDDGLPRGVTLVGRAFADGRLSLLGDRLHRSLPEATLGASDRKLTDAVQIEPDTAPDETAGQVLVAVVGAHLSGQPLNHQLTTRGGTVVATTKTAAGYSLYALPGTVPAKPGLIRDGGRGGIEVEVWTLPVAGFGSFVSEIPPPLGIGTLDLADGTSVKGFLCEPHALEGAADITHLGGWRAFLATDMRAA
ncbi:MAG: allophanate hydrolase [Microvirga sp.]